MKKPTCPASLSKTKVKPRTAAGSVARKRRAAEPSAAARNKQNATNVAITTELAPAVAIALLDKTVQAPGAPAPALGALAAGVSASEEEGKVRVQLVFENGAVLPVEMSVAAGAALSSGLLKEIPKTK